MRKILYLLVLLVIVACSPEKKLARLHKKHPELFTTDTLVIRDTIRISEVKKDTVFKFNNIHDTVTISKDRLVIRTVKLPGDSIWIEGACLGDTIYVEYKVPCEKALIVERPFYQNGWFWVLVCTFILLLFLLLYLLKK